jgi:hypothetical protein
MKILKIIRHIKPRILMINCAIIFIFSLLLEEFISGIEDTNSINGLLKRLGKAIIIGIIATVANTYEMQKNKELNNEP